MYDPLYEFKETYALFYEQQETRVRGYHLVLSFEDAKALCQSLISKLDGFDYWIVAIPLIEDLMNGIEGIGL